MNEIASWRAHIREAAAYLPSLRDDFPNVAARYLSRLPHPAVRLHVSGDFYDRWHLEKWAEAARRLPHKTSYTCQIPPPNPRRRHPQKLNHPPKRRPLQLRRSRQGPAVAEARVHHPRLHARKRRRAPSPPAPARKHRRLLFLNHVQHAPRARADAAWLRRQLRERPGPASCHLMFDTEEFAEGPQCLQCKLR
jgi:hypothetical protein